MQYLHTQITQCEFPVRLANLQIPHIPESFRVENNYYVFQLEEMIHIIGLAKLRTAGHV
jgi:hypothetical protein